MISVVAGPDDTGSIAPPDFSQSGGLRSKWTGGALHARPTLHRCVQAGGSPRAETPVYPTASAARPTAASRATPAPPRAHQCRLTRIIRLLPPRHRSLIVARHPASSAQEVSLHLLALGSLLAISRLLAPLLLARCARRPRLLPWARRRLDLVHLHLDTSRLRRARL